MLPLAGIKVVDMAQVYMGPGAAMYLGDQGAHVIKVEPMKGDSSRWIQTTPYLVERGLSRPFLVLNRYKRSIAVDVHTAEGQEVVHRLAKWADVLILNFRPGAEVGLRLDYDTLAAINPRLIYAAISAFGRDGPEASLPGYDIVIQARSGILSLHRDGDGTPVPSPIMMSDISGCMSLAYAVMLALWDRQKTGKGRRIDISLLHSGLAMQVQQMVWVDNDSTPLPGLRATATASCYQCADDRWVTIVTVEHHQFKALCQVLDLEHLGDDPGFITYEQRTERSTEIHEILDAILCTRPLDEWLGRLKAAGVPCSAVVVRDEVPNDPQTIANNMFLTQDHPEIGRVRMVSPPFVLSDAGDETHRRRPAPTLGEHTDEVLRELDYDESTIASFHERRIVR